MARKNLLKNILQRSTEGPAIESRANYAMRGASKSMKISIDALAEDARKLMDGETIVEIDPSLIDVSFVNDRLSGDDEAFEQLKATIRTGVQETPVLLRPHPSESRRYMIVFGHRRVRVATALGRKVRAVVKSIDDAAHVLAQGQENTAREDLSFIEKALFAKNLVGLGYPKDLIQSSLTVDATLLSRLLSVSQKIPSHIIEAIGAAKSIGRDRWELFKKLVILPANMKRAEEFMLSQDFLAADSNVRFEKLLAELSKKGRAVRKSKPKPDSRTWSAGDGDIKGVLGRSGKAFTISLTSIDAADFGTYLSDQLDELYRSYKGTKQEISK